MISYDFYNKSAIWVLHALLLMYEYFESSEREIFQDPPIAGKWQNQLKQDIHTLTYTHTAMVQMVGYPKVLILNVMLFGGGTLGSDWVMRAGPS